MKFLNIMFTLKLDKNDSFCDVKPYILNGLNRFGKDPKSILTANDRTRHVIKYFYDKI